MRKVIRVLCEKCNREVKGILPLQDQYFSEAANEEFLAGAEQHLKGAHMRREHSFCVVCGNKLHEGEGVWKFIVRSDEISEEDKEKGIEFYLVPGLICYRCQGGEE